MMTSHPFNQQKILNAHDSSLPQATSGCAGQQGNQPSPCSAAASKCCGSTSPVWQLGSILRALPPLSNGCLKDASTSVLGADAWETTGIWGTQSLGSIPELHKVNVMCVSNQSSPMPWECLHTCLAWRGKPNSNIQDTLQTTMP